MCVCVRCPGYDQLDSFVLVIHESVDWDADVEGIESIQRYAVHCRAKKALEVHPGGYCRDPYIPKERLRADERGLMRDPVVGHNPSYGSKRGIPWKNVSQEFFRVPHIPFAKVSVLVPCINDVLMMGDSYPIEDARKANHLGGFVRL